MDAFKPNVTRSFCFILPTQVEVWFSYYPRGSARAADGFASLYLFRDQACMINCDVAIDTRRRSMEEQEEQSVIQAGCGRGWADFVRSGTYRTISVTVFSVQLSESRIRYVYTSRS